MQDLRKHLEDAIHINQTRMPLYAEASEGATLKFSKKLIRLEKWALMGADLFDKQGDKLQSAGIPYIKAEFVDMSHTPAFSLLYPTFVDYTIPPVPVVLKTFKKQIKSSIKARNPQEIVDACEDYLHKLNTQRHVYCMLRHLIESIRRIAYMIPIHQQDCDVLDIAFPSNYSYLLLKLHTRLLTPSKSLDEDVAPIQLKGLPFLYQDFPHIPKVPHR